MRTIESFAREIGVTARVLYLAFVRELPGVHPVLGCETSGQLEQLLRDWEDETVDGALLSALVDRLPSSTPALVDPSLWPEAERPEKAAAQGDRPRTDPVRTAPARSTSRVL